MEWVEETLVSLADDQLAASATTGTRRRCTAAGRAHLPHARRLLDARRRGLNDREEVVDHLMELAEAAYDHKEQELGPT